jgi:glycosyltransferase involved in cell wall biosynthesis
LKILVAHNFYRQPGGEDQVYRSEVALLREFGHAVVPFEVHNDAIAGMGRLRLMAAAVWNRSVAAELGEMVRRERPDVVHFHNTFPLLSPAAYYAARRAGAAVVQTLHNFRLMCPVALFYRDGKPCEECLGKPLAWPGVAHGCYRGSRAATAATVATVTVHRGIGTWDRAIDAYVCLTEFTRGKFVAGGLPPGKLHVKPNFVHPDPGERAGGDGSAVFVGRLSEEKGLLPLLAAWEHLDVPLTIIGSGPLADRVADAAARNPAIRPVGRQTSGQIYDTVGRASMLVLPSVCYENFPCVAAEAFAVGTPIVASGHGAMADVVGADGRLGTLFTPGDPAARAAAVRAMLAWPADAQATLRRNARAEFVARYTGGPNHARLMEIYAAAIATAAARRRPGDDQSRRVAPLAAPCPQGP